MGVTFTFGKEITLPQFDAAIRKHGYRTVTAYGVFIGNVFIGFARFKRLGDSSKKGYPDGT